MQILHFDLFPGPHKLISYHLFDIPTCMSSRHRKLTWPKQNSYFLLPNSSSLRLLTPVKVQSSTQMLKSKPNESFPSFALHILSFRKSS